MNRIGQSPVQFVFVDLNLLDPEHQIPRFGNGPSQLVVIDVKEFEVRHVVNGLGNGPVETVLAQPKVHHVGQRTNLVGDGSRQFVGIQIQNDCVTQHKKGVSRQLVPTNTTTAPAKTHEAS